MSLPNLTGLAIGGNSRALNQRPRVDRAFFAFWTPHLAWLTGLIWTDGCLVGNTIKINAKGRQIPDSVQRLVGANVPVREKHGKPGCYQIEFTDQAVSDFFRGLGLTSNKSRTILWPSVPCRLAPHFVRGVLDGDGWVSKSVRRRAAGFCGASRSFGASLSNWLGSQGVEHRTELSPAEDLFSAPLWRILVNRIGSLVRLHALLYPDSDCPFHEGKRQRFDAILDYVHVNGIKPQNRKPIARSAFAD